MAQKRKAIPKKTRFEVFKRDSFTCQHCGRKAPDVVLQVDHLKPVSKGGKGSRTLRSKPLRNSVTTGLNWHSVSSQTIMVNETSKSGYVNTLLMKSQMEWMSLQSSILNFNKMGR